ncbi:MAG: pseudouridine synthase [Ramlibacter sp.]|nr:pseudouridine synthase [Ramlibacter sp.]
MAVNPRPDAALPARQGVGASCVGLPPGPWPRLIDFLIDRFPGVAPTEWAERMARGEVLDEAGRPVGPTQPYPAHGRLYYYRSLPHEPANPVQETVLFEDDWLVVADKPHFLPVTPTGKYLQETLLVRLRRRLGRDDLVPLHRIDRETAGLVLFAKQRASVRRYADLFATHGVIKTYQAIAPWDASLPFPQTRASTLEEAGHFMKMQERPPEPGAAEAPNARTTIELIETRGALARYRLHPLTGKRHQLRVHMAALGLPLLGDRIYPRLLPEGGDDPTNPLRLLAERLAFTDPVTGQAREFTSEQQLHFPGPA